SLDSICFKILIFAQRSPRFLIIYKQKYLKMYNYLNIKNT
ncbi:LOW QUALITY PROTEIN: hypothetical protein PanWU01x14_195340, partial [Parasponia andersonii]